jgi:hypothetical protein
MYLVQSVAYTTFASTLIRHSLNTADVTSWSGTADPSGAFDDTPFIEWVRIAAAIF